MTYVLFEPYNPDLQASVASQYEEQSRTMLVFTDRELLITNPTSRFILMNTIDRDLTLIASLEEAGRKLFYNNTVSFPIIQSTVVFRNFRFEDDFTIIDTESTNLVRFVAYKLNSRMITFES